MVNFIDEANIKISSGKGGDGCVSFYRGPSIPNGGPDGGHGGRGGDVIIRANSNLTTLGIFKRNRIFKAENGKNGSGSKCAGASGKDIIIEMPVGTQIFDESEDLLLVDLIYPDQQEVLLKGGTGGVGNIAFKSSVNQAPRNATKGEPSSEISVKLKLKLLSDVGIIGLPNVGKSTLLSICTASRTKVADYAFTTINPELGVVFLSDYEEFVMADLPGLIEGASEGAGCGIRFLKHAERCLVILHIIDSTSTNPIEDYKKICNELSNYDENLIKKRTIIALSKMDEVDEKELGKIKNSLEKASGKKVYVFSSLFEDTVNDLMHILYEELKKQRQLQEVD